MIIGLTGKNGAGKGVAAAFFERSGFIAYSLSDAIRDEVKKQKRDVTRETLIETGRKLREDGGPSVLADRVLAKCDIDKNYVIDSIRNPAEVRALKQRKDFLLLCIEADQKLRFERNKLRARENDPTDFKEFVRLEEQELSSTNPAGQQLTATAALADRVAPNNTTIAAFEELLRQIAVTALTGFSRPDWDEYFMELAKVASLRSNCLKRKVAAVIVRDKRVISTGYNGTPRGVKNCNDGGCPRCMGFGASGANLGDCLCSHAEENAIVQAAYHGVSIKDATLYTTFSPCLICTKMILNSGIREVVYNAAYPMGDLPLTLLQEAGIVARKTGQKNQD